VGEFVGIDVVGLIVGLPLWEGPLFTVAEVSTSANFASLKVAEVKMELGLLMKVAVMASAAASIAALLS